MFGVWTVKLFFWNTPTDSPNDIETYRKKLPRDRFIEKTNEQFLFLLYSYNLYIIFNYEI